MQAVVSGGSSWEKISMSHASMVDLQRRLAQNVQAEFDAMFAFMDTTLRKVGPELNPCPAISHASNIFTWNGCSTFYQTTAFLLKTQVHIVALSAFFN